MAARRRTPHLSGERISGSEALSLSVGHKVHAVRVRDRLTGVKKLTAIADQTLGCVQFIGREQNESAERLPASREQTSHPPVTTGAIPPTRDGHFLSRVRQRERRPPPEAGDRVSPPTALWSRS
jgi:hypothetical protein